jgi:hypothetical protein
VGLGIYVFTGIDSGTFCTSCSSRVTDIPMDTLKVSKFIELMWTSWYEQAGSFGDVLSRCFFVHTS